MGKPPIILPGMQVQRVMPVVETTYTRMLRRMNIKFSYEEPFLVIGKNSASGGWILHLSVVRNQVEELFHAVLPYLAKEKVPCKIYPNDDWTGNVIEGNLGYNQLGKVVTIYPKDKQQAQQVVEDLLKITAKFFGPQIPTDIHLGGIVYARYGSINPEITTDANGVQHKYYLNKWGMRVKDEYHIPYKPLPYADWFFDKWAKNQEPPMLKYLKRKYLVFVPIKKDSKGSVYKGVDLRNMWWKGFDWCIIKEGKKYMAYDEHGRDIVDRLLWQKEIHEDLSGKVNVPRIIDYFQKGESYFLIMKRIKGPSFQDLVDTTLHNRAWFSVEQSGRIKLLQHLLNILGQVKTLHENGYVHRDLTPANFVIRNDQKEYLIDLELSYNFQKRKPSPVFKYGTNGYMSPEQMRTEPPTVKEDIYAIGAMITYVVTGFNPARIILPGNEKDTVRRLQFFTHDPQIAALIAICVQEDPAERPSLDEILMMVNHILKGTHARKAEDPRVSKPPDELLTGIIEGGLTGLQDPGFYGSEGLWNTGIAQDSDTVVNARADRMIMGGFGDGLSGIMYVLSVAQQAGYRYRGLSGILKKAIHWLETGVWNEEKIPSNAPGLTTGSAGVAIGLSKGLKSGLLPVKSIYKAAMSQCLQMASSDLDLSGGITGQGIALISCLKNDPDAKNRLDEIVAVLLSTQGEDGSWTFRNKIGREVKNPWFWDGVSGVVYFLGLYLEQIGDPEHKVSDSLKKGLSWLRYKANLEQSFLDQQMKGKLPPKYSLRSGRAGMALSFIQGYKVTGDENYKDRAAQLLNEIPKAFMRADLSLWTGMAGIGLVYVEAFQVFKSQQWQYLADWIAESIIRLVKHHENGYHTWLVESGRQMDANLYDGQAGVLFFLMRYRDPEHINPLFF